jgi:hypothetical protein
MELFRRPGLTECNLYRTSAVIWHDRLFVFSIHPQPFLTLFLYINEIIVHL